MKQEHTPGPWSSCQNGRCSCGIIWGGGDYPVAEVQSGEWGDSYPALRLVGDTSFDQKAEPYIEHINYGMGASPEEAAANARLIAAAPELLAALIDIVCRYDPSEQGIESPLFTQAKRAINKALNWKPQFPAHDERLERTARFHHE